MASTCHGFIGFHPLPNYKENIANLLAANALYLWSREDRKSRAPWVFQSNSLSHCPLPSPGTWTSLGQHLGLHLSWSIPYQQTLYKQVALRNDKNINDKDFFHRKIHDMNKMKHNISSHETSQNIICTFCVVFLGTSLFASYPFLPNLMDWCLFSAFGSGSPAMPCLCQVHEAWSIRCDLRCDLPASSSTD